MTERTYIHKFESTGEAYGACQCDERINKGDVLVIIPEGVVGIAHTWPFAITTEAGKLHKMADGYSLARIAAEDGFPDNTAPAMAIATAFGWGV